MNTSFRKQFIKNYFVNKENPAVNPNHYIQTQIVSVLVIA